MYNEISLFRYSNASPLKHDAAALINASTRAIVQSTRSFAVAVLRLVNKSCPRLAWTIPTIESDTRQMAVTRQPYKYFPCGRFSSSLDVHSMQSIGGISEHHNTSFTHHFLASDDIGG